MGRIKSLPKLSALTFLLSQMYFMSNAAFAAGYQINEVSPGLQGAATAGAAAANNDVSSMFANPATLSTLLRNQLYLGGSEIMPSIEVSRESATHTVIVPGVTTSSISAPVMGETSQGSLSKSAFIPDIYLGWRINNKFVFGIAAVVPFGLTTGYDNNSVLRFAAHNTSVEAIDINPAISYALNDKLSLGLGLQVQYLQGNFSNFDGPYTGVPAIDALVASTHSTYVMGSSWGYGYTLGALFKPDDVTRLGIGYRSSISEQLSGNGRQFTSPGGITPAPSQSFLFNAGTTDHAAVRTPAVLTLSAARDINKWTVKASAQMNFWSSFQQLSINMPQAFAVNSTIQAHWRNVWLLTAGADYRLTDDWTVRGGLAYDQTPTQDAYRDPRVPDADRYWLSLGASYQLNKNVSIDGAYTHIFFRNQNVNVTQASGTSATGTTPLEINQVSAHYQGSADILGLAVRCSI